MKKSSIPQYCIMTYLKQGVHSDWLIRHLLFAHGCMLLTYSLTKAKRALCDVVQFVPDSLGCASWVHIILTTVMTRIVVDKSTDYAKPHSICCFFYHNIKVIEINICLDNWKYRLTLESARTALCKWAVCTRQIFLSKTITNSLNMQKQYNVYVIKQMVNAIACTIELWMH